MNNCKITDKKMPCIILSVLFWGIFIGIDLFFGNHFGVI